MSNKQLMAVFITDRKYVMFTVEKPQTTTVKRPQSNGVFFLAQFRASSVWLKMTEILAAQGSSTFHSEQKPKLQHWPISPVIVVLVTLTASSMLSLISFLSGSIGLASGFSMSFSLGLECSSLDSYLANFLTSFKSLLKCHLLKEDYP